MLVFSISYAFLLGIAAPVTPSGSMLHSIAELNDFSDDPSHRHAPFCVTGTVQTVNAPPDNYLVLSDASGWVEIFNASSSRIAFPSSVSYTWAVTPPAAFPSTTSPAALASGIVITLPNNGRRPSTTIVSI